MTSSRSRQRSFDPGDQMKTQKAAGIVQIVSPDIAITRIAGAEDLIIGIVFDFAGLV